MLKPITFTVETKEKGSSFELRVQNAKTRQEYILKTNPETLQLEQGEEYVYLLKVHGKEKSQYTLTIDNATDANSPVTTSIPVGKNYNAIADSFIV